jgi:hypothetical protein
MYIHHTNINLIARGWLIRAASRRMCAVLLVLLSATPAASQTVTGRIVGDTETEVLRGAVVSLLDASGTRVRSALTNAQGLFTIRATGPGTYRITAEMIGRKSAESSSFEIGETPVHITLTLTSAPIELEALVINGESRCALKGELGAATVRVWGEVEKALRAERVTRELQLYQFDITRGSKSYDPNSMLLSDHNTVKMKTVAHTPFRSLSAQAMATEGFARQLGSHVMFYGPDTDVLLSREFQDTHCFSLRRKGEDQIGLVFKPVPGRKVTDIEGVLWLDAETAELQRLEFKYRRVPAGMPVGSYSGFIEFQRLEIGAWIIGRWQLNTPLQVEEAEVMALEPVGSLPTAGAATEPVGSLPAAGAGASVNVPPPQP